MTQPALMETETQTDEPLGVTDWAVDLFRNTYDRDDIDRDDVFAYSYGVMHCPVWRSTYEHELQRQMPRIPMASDFDTFRDAGDELLTLHADYETGPQNLAVCVYLGDDLIECDERGEPVTPIADALLRVTKTDWMIDGQRLTSLAKGRDIAETNAVARHLGVSEVTQQQVDDVRADDATMAKVTAEADEEMRSLRLRLNADLSLGDFPDGTFDYQVSGRTPLEWAARYLVNDTNKQTGLSEDVNDYELWADDPFELVRYLRRLVHVSVRSTEIIDALPNSLEGSHMAGDTE